MSNVIDLFPRSKPRRSVEDRRTRAPRDRSDGRGIVIPLRKVSVRDPQPPSAA
jgi:hypothetical protein